MKRKDETLDALKEFCRQVGTPHELLTDMGSEFVNKPLTSFCRDQGIRTVHSPPYRAAANGLVERANKTLKDMARCMLLDSGLPPTFWLFALQTAAYVSNCLASVHGPTPYELMTPVSHGRAPNMQHLRVFGSPCYACIEPDLRKAATHKAHAELGIFVGYSDTSDGCHEVFLPRTKQVITRRDTVCDEPFSSSIDVLLGKYSKPPTEVPTFHTIESTNTKPRSAIQADVDRLFNPGKPTMHAGPNDMLHRTLKNTCSSTAAAYIQARAAALHGITFMQARHKRFPTSDNKSKSRLM